MKFIYHIILRVTLSISVVLGVWAILFYYTIVDEVNDETDDVLEDYSTMIIQNFLSGEEMPTNDNGSNNTYYLRSVSMDSLEVAKANEGFANENIYIEYKRENEPARLLRQLFRDANDNYYEVTVITPTIDSDDLIEAIWKSLVILSTILLMIILIINVLAIRKGMYPLDRFMRWLHNSDIENCILPTIKDSNIKEIKELTKAIETFAKRGRRAFEEQKEFISNASHELQTPIAICQNRLELLLDSELSEQQMEDIAACLTTLSRLTRLNKSLLMLSRIENGGFDSGKVDVNQVVYYNLKSLEELYAHRKISISIKEMGNCTVKANSDLISTLIVNLLKNSYSHNIDKGEVIIEIGVDSLRVSNSGVDRDLDSSKIFNRFYQGSSKSGSYGLGLPIVYAICRLYNYKTAYLFKNKLHQFEIKFK